MANVANLANWIDSRLMKIEAFFQTHTIPHIEHLDQDVKPLMDAYSAQHYGQDSEMHKSNMRRMNYVISTFKLVKMHDYLRVTSHELRNEGGVDVNFVKDLRKVILDNDGIWLDGGRGSTWPDGLDAHELKRMAKKNKHGHKNGHPVKDAAGGAVNGKTVVAIAEPAHEIAATAVQEKIIAQKEGGSSLNEEQDLTGGEVAVEEEEVVAASDLTDEATPGNGSTEAEVEVEVENDDKEIQTSVSSNQEEKEEDKKDQPEGDDMTNKESAAKEVLSNPVATNVQTGQAPEFHKMELSYFSSLIVHSFFEKLKHNSINTFGDVAKHTREELKQLRLQNDSKRKAYSHKNTIPEFEEALKPFGLHFKDDPSYVVEEQCAKGDVYYPTYVEMDKAGKKYTKPRSKTPPVIQEEVNDPEVFQKIIENLEIENPEDLFKFTIKDLVEQSIIDITSPLNRIADNLEFKCHYAFEVALRSNETWGKRGYDPNELNENLKLVEPQGKLRLGLYQEAKQALLEDKKKLLEEQEKQRQEKEAREQFQTEAQEKKSHFLSLLKPKQP